MFARTTLTFLILTAAIAVTTPVWAQASDSAIASARRLGDLDRLKALAEASDDSEALTVRAELALLGADLAAATRFAETARQRATKPGDAARAVALQARAMYELGQAAEAEELLRGHLSQHPMAHRVRFALGELLAERGADGEAEVVLGAMSAFFNNNVLKTSDDLTVLSKSMATIGAFDDANYAMERAIELDPQNAESLVAWGELLLSKYNTADAEVTFDEVLKLNPNHVEARVGKARVEMQLSNDYAKVRNHLDAVSRVAPEHVGMLLTRAEIAIYDTNCEGARKFAQQVLDKRPRQLEALSIVAACHYLDDDLVAFQKSRKHILSLNPQYARLMSETSRYAVRVHRYEEAAKLDRQALEIDPDHAPALIGLGIGLSRIGKEDQALEVLRRAFEADPYNVLAFNMVELYEQSMKDYVFTKHERFLLRAHRTEQELMDALVTPVVEEALATFDAKYGFKPADDFLAVEIFPNAATFSVRSVGLPNISPHGICFGKVVVSRSPSEGNFNWRQVIWHELAHVYHIQLAQSRVPRWFTEGLAEYETNVKEAGWQRHHDRELARALNAGNLRGVLELSHGFTHARSHEEILRAYHQSSLVIHFIAQTWKFEVLPQMLRAWAARKSTPEVLKSVLGLDAEAFDKQFAQWLRKRYMNFERQHTVDLAGIAGAAELELKVRANADDAVSWAKLGIARYRESDVPGADTAMAQATTHAAGDPTVNMIATMYFYDRGRVKDAYAHGLKVLDAGKDSYDLRVLLGSAAVKLQDVDAAEVHYRAAATLWHNGAEAWSGIQRIARAAKDDELFARARDRLFYLDQHDPRAARMRVEAARKARNWAMALESAQRWMDINPQDSRSLEAVIEAAIQLGEPARAASAWHSLAVLRPSDAEVILLRAIRELKAAGRDTLVSNFVERARQAEVPEDKITEALR